MTESADWVARLAHEIGSDAVETHAAVRAFAVDGRTPHCVLFPETVEALSRGAAAAHAAGRTVIPVGNGTQLGVGGVPRQYDVALSTRRLRRILAHEAGDMTVTVEAGRTLAELNDALGCQGQRLPLDPPHPEYTTIGALIATDASGPLRLSQGKVRDLLIGITAVLADGTVVRSGGRVVKNVAGYDLMKLFTGSFGTLGIIVEATFKVRPCPAQEAVFVIAAPSTGVAVATALAVLAAPLEPLYVEALNGAAAATLGAGTPGAAVVVGCGGGLEQIAVQRARLMAQFGAGIIECESNERGRLGSALRDFPCDGMGEGGRGEGLCGCKISVSPSRLGEVLQRIEEEAGRSGLDAAILAHVGSGVAMTRFGSGAAVNQAFSNFAPRLRQTVRTAGGWVVFDALPVALKGEIDVWGFDTPALTLMRGIKQTLDPHRRLSPGRFVGGI